MAFDPVRIIPALAGNTAINALFQFREGDHPRSRGEYVTSTFDSPAKFGSSPLSRGILLLRGCFSLLRRIIPALAGNTETRGRGC